MRWTFNDVELIEAFSSIDKMPEFWKSIQLTTSIFRIKFPEEACCCYFPFIPFTSRSHRSLFMVYLGFYRCCSETGVSNIYAETAESSIDRKPVCSPSLFHLSFILYTGGFKSIYRDATVFIFMLDLSRVVGISRITICNFLFIKKCIFKQQSYLLYIEKNG